MVRSLDRYAEDEHGGFGWGVPEDEDGVPAWLGVLKRDI